MKHERLHSYKEWDIYNKDMECYNIRKRNFDRTKEGKE